MTIRFVFRCSRCGSKSFRPSMKRAFKDSILRLFGITPQRCFKCRRRFYLYRPAGFYALLKALAAPPVPATKGTPDVVWSRFIKVDPREGRS
jgi:hypothetical protein